MNIKWISTELFSGFIWAFSSKFSPLQFPYSDSKHPEHLLHDLDWQYIIWVLMTPHLKAKEDLFWWFHTDIKQHMRWQLRSDIPHSLTIGSVALSQDYWLELPTQKWNYSRIVPSNLRYHAWHYWMQPVGLHFPYQSRWKPTNKAVNAISNLWLSLNPV